MRKKKKKHVRTDCDRELRNVAQKGEEEWDNEWKEQGGTHGHKRKLRHRVLQLTSHIRICFHEREVGSDCEGVTAVTSTSSLGFLPCLIWQVLT
jgi:hypothetical protein